MPQKTLFDGWEVASVKIEVKLETNRPGGRVTVAFENELGKPCGSRTVRWTKDRDVTDIGLVARDVLNAFLWAPHLEMVEAVDVAVRKHLPPVPAAGVDTDANLL